MSTEFHYIYNARTGQTLRVLALPSIGGRNDDWEVVSYERAQRLWADAREAALLAEAMASAPPPDVPPVGEDDLSGTGEETPPTS